MQMPCKLGDTHDSMMLEVTPTVFYDIVDLYLFEKTETSDNFF